MNTMTSKLSKTKILMWIHLLHGLGPDASNRFHEVTQPLLDFVFGPPPYLPHIGTVGGSTLIFPKALMPTAAKFLSSLLAEAEKIPANTFCVPRSHAWLNPEEFTNHAQQLGQLVLLVLNSKPAEKEMEPPYRILIRSYLDRCSGKHFELALFIRSLLELVTKKPELMDFTLDVLGNSLSSSGPIASSIIPVLAGHADILVNYYATNQRLLPNHPFLDLFFRAGVEWSVSEFTAQISDALATLPDSIIDPMEAVTFLWKKMAKALLATPVNVLFTNPFIQISDLSTFIFRLPQTWPTFERLPSFLTPIATRLRTNQPVRCGAHSLSPGQNQIRPSWPEFSTHWNWKKCRKWISRLSAFS